MMIVYRLTVQAHTVYMCFLRLEEDMHSHQQNIEYSRRELEAEKKRCKHMQSMHRNNNCVYCIYRQQQDLLAEKKRQELAFKEQYQKFVLYMYMYT